MFASKEGNDGNYMQH